MNKLNLRSLSEFIFYGNYFYGFCMMALVLETVVQLHLNLQNAFFFGMTFIATVLFYNHPNARNYSSNSNNPRELWYSRHHQFILINQILFSFCLLLGGIYLLLTHQSGFLQFGPQNWILTYIFPLVGAFYYGGNVLSRRYNLRQFGLVKPFAIGFVWAGMSNVYPILYSSIIHNIKAEINLLGFLLFLKSFMFVSLLAILFDIKDYVVDSKQNLNTLIVKFGLKKTIFYVLIPFTTLGLLSFISFAIFHHLSLLKMVLLMIPYLSLLFVTRLFKKRRKLLFYLIVIDGLLLVKAVFGIVAAQI